MKNRIVLRLIDRITGTIVVWDAPALTQVLGLDEISDNLFEQ